MKLKFRVIAANSYSFTIKMNRSDSNMYTVLTLPNKQLKVKVGDMISITINKEN